MAVSASAGEAVTKQELAGMAATVLVGVKESDQNDYTVGEAKAQRHYAGDQCQFIHD